MKGDELIGRTWICDRCGQPLESRFDRCNSGIHEGPGYPMNEATGRAVAAHEVVAAARAVLETRGEPSSLARLAKAMRW
jgi:hypothetical protein